MFTLYRIRNLINQKVYIGQTSEKICGQRKRQHFHQLRHNKHKNKHLQSAYNKYGAKAFKYEIIEVCDSLASLNQLEKIWIAFYKFQNKAYNHRLGGDNNLNSEESKARMKIAQNKPELLELRSKVHKGKPKSSKHIEKIRQSNLKTKNKYPILQYDSRTGNLLNTFESLASCVKHTGLNESSISILLKTGRAGTKFIFRRGNDPRPIKLFKYSFQRKIIQLDLNDNILNEFESIKEAADKLGLQKSAICNCCKGKLKKTGNYKFQYKNIDTQPET